MDLKVMVFRVEALLLKFLVAPLPEYLQKKNIKSCVADPHWIRIRIQIQGFDEQKSEKIYS